MNVWNKVFLGIIVATSIAVVALGAVNFHIRNTGQKKIADWEMKIAKANEDIAKIYSGADFLKPLVEKSLDERGFDEIKGKIIERFDLRGRAWFGCKISDAKEKKLNPALQQVEVQVTITEPLNPNKKVQDPNKKDQEPDVFNPEILKGVVYAFEVFERKFSDSQGNETIAVTPGKFLGRFMVTSVPQTKPFSDNDIQKTGFAVTLVTADPLNDDEMNHILATAAPEYKAENPESRWAIYLTPPVHQLAGIFDQLTDEERLQIMTSQPVAELSEEDKQKFLEEFKQTFESAPRTELTEEEKAGAGNDAQAIAMWEQFRQALDDPESEQARGFTAAMNWLYLRRSSLNRDIAIMQTNCETSVKAKEMNEVENKKLEVDCGLEEKRCKAMVEQGEHVKGLVKQYDDEKDKKQLQIEKHQALQESYLAKIAESQLKVVETIEGQIGEKNTDDKTETGAKTAESR